MFTAGLDQAQVLSTVQGKLVALRNALEAAADLYGWSAGISAADLVGLGFSQADADSLLSAISDANAVAQLYEVGLPPSTYPQPPSAYVYGASQRQVIGPQ